MRGSEGVDGGSTPGGRVDNVDVLRAIAALMVLAGHAYLLSGRGVAVVADRWYDVFVLAGASGVWLFFAVSGYVIGKPFLDRLVSGGPLPDIPSYAVRRAVRIFPLYWVALIAFIVIAGAGATKAWQYPAHFLLLHNAVPGREHALLGVSWTLSIEVLFYGAVPLLAFGVRRWRRTVTAEWLAGAIVATWIASIAITLPAAVFTSGADSTWAHTFLPAVWQMFCPGLLVALGPHLTSRRWRRWVVDFPRRRGAMVLAFGMFALAAVVGPNAPLRFGTQFFTLEQDALRPVLAVSFGIILAASIHARPTRSRVALRLGVVSYGLYLLHAVVFEFLERYWVPLSDQSLAGYFVHLGLLAGLTIPLALVSWRYFEDPLIRRARAAVSSRRRRQLA